MSAEGNTPEQVDVDEIGWIIFILGWIIFILHTGNLHHARSIHSASS